MMYLFTNLNRKTEICDWPAQSTEKHPRISLSPCLIVFYFGLIGSGMTSLRNSGGNGRDSMIDEKYRAIYQPYVFPKSIV